MKTVEELHASCVEEGECLIWTGKANNEGYPVFSAAKGECNLARRLAFTLYGGVLKPRMPVIATCGDRKCVAKEHLQQVTTSKVGKIAAAKGAYSSLKRRAAIAKSKAGVCKITDAEVLEIRMSDEVGHVLAARYGVCKSLINKIKAGKSRVDYKNPYMSLMN